MQAYTVLKKSKFHADPYSLFYEFSKGLDDAVLLESKMVTVKTMWRAYCFCKMR